MTKYYSAKAMQILQWSAMKVIAAVAEGDMLRTSTAILRRLGKYELINTVSLSRQIARHVLAAGRYTI
jgi:hypothetical protein